MGRRACCSSQAMTVGESWQRRLEVAHHSCRQGAKVRTSGLSKLPPLSSDWDSPCLWNSAAHVLGGSLPQLA